MPALPRDRALLVEFDSLEERALLHALVHRGIKVVESSLGAATGAGHGDTGFDLVMVSGSDIDPADLAPAVIHLRLAYPGARLLLIADTLPRPDLLALAFAEVDAIVHRPFRADLVMALIDAMLGEKDGVFKTCPTCLHTWQDRESFLEDGSIDMLGVQTDFGHPGEGYLLFNHLREGCHTTMALPVSRFLDFYIGPRFHQNAYATAGCMGHCLEADSLAPCPAECTQRTAREVMLALLRHFRAVHGRS